MRQWVNLDVAFDIINRQSAGKRIAAVDIHCAGTADAFAAGAAKCQCRIYLIFDLDQSVQNHRAAAANFDFIGVDARIFAAIGIVAIHRKATHLARPISRFKMLAFPDPGIWWQSELSQVGFLLCTQVVDELISL